MNVTELRVARRWSVSELAKRAGLRESLLEDIEAGKGEMLIDSLTAVANGLEVSFAEIVRRRVTKPS